MTPIVKNAIQAVVPRNIIAIATARKTIPIGRNAAPPLPFARPLDSDMGFLSPFTWPTLRGRQETCKCFRDWPLLWADYTRMPAPIILWGTEAASEALPEPWRKLPKDDLGIRNKNEDAAE